jgi:hypothetical protein
MANQFLEVRTNLTLGVNYETSAVAPQVEMIFLTANPNYVVGENNTIARKVSIREFRMQLDPDHLKRFIVDLVKIAENLDSFAKLKDAINVVVKDDAEIKATKSE